MTQVFNEGVHLLELWADKLGYFDKPTIVELIEDIRGAQSRALQRFQRQVNDWFTFSGDSDRFIRLLRVVCEKISMRLLGWLLTLSWPP